MPDPTPDGDARKTSYALDLSSNAARGTRPRKTTPKGFVPVVQKTINLSTPKAEKSEPQSALQPNAPRRGAQSPGARLGAPARRGAQNGSAPRGNQTPDAPRDAGGRPSGGTSLADLLDEATLARLRGKG